MVTPVPWRMLVAARTTQDIHRSCSTTACVGEYSTDGDDERATTFRCHRQVHDVVRCVVFG
jgi:hypothetical protein